MTREQFIIVAKIIQKAYPQYKTIPDEESLQVWYATLNDLELETLIKAAQKHIQTKKYPPSIAELRETAAAIQDKGELPELEAWALVRKALSNANYNADAEYNKLPDTLQRAVGSPSNLREWATMPTDTVESVIHSNWLKAYRVETERAKERRSVKPELRQLYALSVQERLGLETTPDDTAITQDKP